MINFKCAVLTENQVSVSNELKEYIVHIFSTVSNKLSGHRRVFSSGHCLVQKNILPVMEQSLSEASHPPEVLDR